MSDGRGRSVTRNFEQVQLMRLSRQREDVERIVAARRLQFACSMSPPVSGPSPVSTATYCLPLTA